MQNLLLGRKPMTNLDSVLKKQRHYPANKGLCIQDYSLPSGHVQLCKLDCKGRLLKNWCFWTVVLEKTLESPLGSKKIKPVNPKENQPWIFTGKTDAVAEAPILWPPDMKRQLIGKDPHAREDWRQKKKEVTEDEMVGWYHQLNEHELEQTPGDSEGQGSLVCCSPWGHKESDTT